MTDSRGVLSNNEPAGRAQGFRVTGRADDEVLLCREYGATAPAGGGHAAAVVEGLNAGLEVGGELNAHYRFEYDSDIGLQRFVWGTYQLNLRAVVTVEKQRASFSTDCSLHLSTGLTLQAHGEGGDAYSSFDTAAEHLEKRLRRYKRRLKDHHANRKQPVSALTAAGYVIEADGAETEEPADLSPAIIAENSHTIAELSVGEAVMQMDISNEPFALFRNPGHGGLNVVYRRKDGNIGWVDPGPAGSADAN